MLHSTELTTHHEGQSEMMKIIVSEMDIEARLCHIQQAG